MVARFFALFRAPRRTAVLVGLLLALATLAGFGYAAVRRHFRIENHRALAHQAIHAADFETAKVHLLAYLAFRPLDAEAHFRLAQACRRGRFADFDQTRKHLLEAERLGWLKEDTALEGLMLGFQEHPSRQVEQLFADYVHADKPNSALVLEALTRGDLHANHQGDASRWLNAWVARYPEDWYAHLWRGAFFEYRNEPGLAIAYFEQVLAHRPDDREARYRMGLMQVQSGYGYEEALGYLEPYCRQHPNDADARIAPAECRRALGRGKEARVLLETVLASHPRHFEATLGLALLAVDDGDYEEALKWLRRLEPLAYESHYEQTLQRLEHLQPVANNKNVPDQLRPLFYLLAKVLHRKGCHAVGAILTLESGPHHLRRVRKGGGSYLSSSDGRVLFGLGSRTADRLRVRWPSGKTEVWESDRLGRDHYLTAIEGEGRTVDAGGVGH